MASILCYSDQPILAIGLTEILSAVPDLELMDCCTTRERLLEVLATKRPDLLLLDLTPDFTLEFLTTVHQMVRQAKIVLWVHFISTEMALQAMGVGVRGIISKTLAPEVVTTGLRKINDGELWFEKALTDSLLTARRYTLTRREGQIVTLVAQGLKNRELGIALNISEGTVKVYLSRLFKKLGLKDRFELALFGLKNLTTGYGTQSTGKSGNRPAPLCPEWAGPTFVLRGTLAGTWFRSAAFHKDQLVSTPGEPTAHGMGGIASGSLLHRSPHDSPSHPT